MDGVSLVRSNRTVLAFISRSGRPAAGGKRQHFHGMLWGQCSACASSSQNYAPYIKQRLNRQNWEWKLDGTAEAPYLINSMAPGFITYDGPASTARKVRYVKNRRFGGVFMWELSASYDGHSQDLLNAMYNEWTSSR